mmetsp:Transcript_89686/g.239666  ORF Transcript_89686/g.239666 Transcript_89686/m.239666 type:complete len:250 (-) Transcript_89686:146-895(-)|eukprot:CAMPEP_0113663450 /NCGR_PEP_ID=MMETSP0038_2-20120614/1148_1 /TAXON_ID=2898 /ORGANISM="Cryptomonas paramecium" /LENGTH=249 /DNA_ID=CAMNT_0000578477 /DNA_START=131 /DNA_END=880 /DNA_ORIENTATION=+ /assembly_acc=CAM_ASM_000170
MGAHIRYGLEAMRTRAKRGLQDWSSSESVGSEGSTIHSLSSKMSNLKVIQDALAPDLDGSSTDFSSSPDSVDSDCFLKRYRTEEAVNCQRWRSSQELLCETLMPVNAHADNSEEVPKRSRAIVRPRRPSRQSKGHRHDIVQNMDMKTAPASSSDSDQPLEQSADLFATWSAPQMETNAKKADTSRYGQLGFLLAFMNPVALESKAKPTCEANLLGASQSADHGCISNPLDDMDDDLALMLKYTHVVGGR